LILYRITQEALNNIEKHAGATKTVLRLIRRKGRMCLSIRDNGRGFLPSAARAGTKRKDGFGLANIRERAGFAGGTLEIKSAPGRGTQLLISIPMKSV